VQDIDANVGEPYYLVIDHAVQFVVPAERVERIRAYLDRMPWPPDMVHTLLLDDHRVQIRAVYAVGTLEFAFRTMARLVAQVQRDAQKNRLATAHQRASS